MKGVIASLAPGVAVHDAAHGIASGDVRAAAWALSQYWQLWPEGTIHVCVIDPGVGTPRAALLASADGRHLLAPDNGLLSLVAAEAAGFEARRLRPDVLRSGSCSEPFHGRDVFAIAAARLAVGDAPSALCTGTVNPAILAWASPERLPDGGLRGEVLHIDRFGNAVTNLRPGDLPSGRWTFRAGRAVFSALLRTYGEAAPGAPLVYTGSSGRIEVAVRGGSAEKELDLARGTPIIVRLDDGKESTR